MVPSNCARIGYCRATFGNPCKKAGGLAPGWARDSPYSSCNLTRGVPPATASGRGGRSCLALDRCLVLHAVLCTQAGSTTSAGFGYWQVDRLSGVVRSSLCPRACREGLHELLVPRRGDLGRTATPTGSAQDVVALYAYNAYDNMRQAPDTVGKHKGTLGLPAWVRLSTVSGP